MSGKCFGVGEKPRSNAMVWWIMVLTSMSCGICSKKLYINPMRISSKSKIAFHVLLDIAAHTAQKRAISVPLICLRHGLSRSYLEVIFSQLKAAGMIQSHRGPGGGYSLALDPEKITLHDVVVLMNDHQPIRADLSAELWIGLDLYMSLQMQQVNLAFALQNARITVEEGTKGLCLPRVNIPAKVDAQVKPNTHKNFIKRLKPRLGPNSVFAFGKYLKTI